MATYLSGLKRLSFDGITIPYQTIRVSGGQRDHVHEFPKVPGGLPELFGRKLYEINVRARYDEGIMRAGGFYQGRNLFANLQVLRSRWEDGRSGPLYLPNIGEIKAYATTWTQELDTKIQSGEAVDVSFREDSDAANLIAKTLSSKPFAALATSLGNFDAVMPSPPPDIFAQIRDAVNSVLAYRDTAQMWAGFIAAKLEGLLNLFRSTYEESVDIFNDPLQFELLEAFKALWAAVQEVDDSAGELSYYTTTRQMSVGEISMAIYKDSTHATDIMSLNPLDDPYNVPAGTKIRFLRSV